jgi:hypothetical protein
MNVSGVVADKGSPAIGAALSYYTVLVRLAGLRDIRDCRGRRSLINFCCAGLIFGADVENSYPLRPAN